jgi:hypothetical protein
LSAAPGVWYRLLCQSALAVQAAHNAGLYHGHLDAGSFVLTTNGEVKMLGLGEPRWLAGSAGEDDPESAPGDLLALGRIAASWAPPISGKSKSKGLPNELLSILARLQSKDRGYPSAQALLDDLESASTKVPGSSSAWDRLLRQVLDQVGPESKRQSA